MQLHFVPISMSTKVTKTLKFYKVKVIIIH